MTRAELSVPRVGPNSRSPYITQDAEQNNRTPIALVENRNCEDANRTVGQLPDFEGTEEDSDSDGDEDMS